MARPRIRRPGRMSGPCAVCRPRATSHAGAAAHRQFGEGGLAALRQHQAFTAGVRDGVAELPRRVDPEVDRLLDAVQGGRLGLAVGAATGELGNETTCEEADALRIAWRTSRTWYGFAWLPSRCRLISSRTPSLLKIWWLPRTRSVKPSRNRNYRSSSKRTLASDRPLRIFCRRPSSRLIPHSTPPRNHLTEACRPW